MANNSKTRKKHRILLTFALIVLALALFVVGYYALNAYCEKGNPHILFLADNEMRENIGSIERIDEDGRLYFMKYTGKPDQKIPTLIMKLLAKSGCTAFTAANENGEQILCRNFDYAHLTRSGELTGVAAVIDYQPEGGYRSLNGVDITVLNETGVCCYEAGMLDDGKTDLSLMALLPWICMDGMNEKGLSASILYLDVKDGEAPTYQREPGRESGSITLLMRHILDRCADTQEAIALAQDYNLLNITGNDYHLLLTDADGSSVLLEWRDQQMQVVETDIATNFYQCSDDAADCYYGEVLKEKWCGSASTEKTYRYGYGHGYARFCTAAEALDGKESITQTDAWALLRSTEQTYGGGFDSQTIYGVIYNCGQKCAEVRMCDGTEYYRFTMN